MENKEQMMICPKAKECGNNCPEIYKEYQVAHLRDYACDGFCKGVTCIPVEPVESEMLLTHEEMVKAMFDWSESLPTELPEITQKMRFEVIAKAQVSKTLSYKVGQSGHTVGEILALAERVHPEKGERLAIVKINYHKIGMDTQHSDIEEVEVLK